MSEPCEFVNLITNYFPYLIVGSIALIGATIVVLWKAKLLVLKQNNNRAVCSSHADCVRTVTNIERKQAEMAKQQQLNVDALEEGKKEFKDIKNKINSLRVGVAVLLDRSGGTLKEFSDVVIDKKGG